MPFQFAAMHLWTALLLVPIIVLTAVHAQKALSAVTQKFADSKLRLTTIAPLPSPQSLRLRLLVTVTTLSCLVLALLRPQYGFTTIPLPRLKASIVICLDNSLSMGAEDYKPSRFEHARRKLLDLLGRMRGERIGLITFAGVPFVESPLTDDYASLKTFILSLKPQASVAPGSDIGSAITTATGLFPKNGEPQSNSNAILIVSDGETTVGDMKTAQARAESVGAKVFALLVATPTGAPVPVTTSGHGGFKYDRNGNIVISKLETTELESLATQTGGTVVISTPGNQDLQQLYDTNLGNGGLGRLSTSIEVGEQELQVWNEYYQLPLIIALLLVFGESIHARIRKRRLITLPLLALSLVAAMYPTRGECEPAENEIGQEAAHYFDQGNFAEALKRYRTGKATNPEDKRFAEGEAAALLRLGSTEEAEAAYRRLAAEATKGAMKGRQLFQAGVAAYRGNRLDVAKSLFEQSLKEEPNDEEAQANLRFIEKLLKDQQQSSSKSNSAENSSAKSESAQSESTESDSAQPISAQSSSGQFSSAESGGGQSVSAKSDSTHSGSEGSEAGQANGNDSEGTQSDSASSTPGSDTLGGSSSSNENSDQLQYLLDNLEEDPNIREQFRREQAAQLLRQSGRTTRPEKDW